MNKPNKPIVVAGYLEPNLHYGDYDFVFAREFSDGTRNSVAASVAAEQVESLRQRGMALNGKMYAKVQIGAKPGQVNRVIKLSFSRGAVHE